MSAAVVHLVGGEAGKRAALQLALARYGVAVAPERASRAEGVLVLLHSGNGETGLDTGLDAAQHDEATQAGVEGRLINVLLRETTLAPAFANAPVFDLSRWRGATDNPALIDLAIHLKTFTARSTKSIQNTGTARIPTPPPIWWQKLSKHWLVAGFIAVISFIALAFAQNIVNAEIACSINFPQPQISDLCGTFGLGNKPKRAERIAWKKVDRNQCEQLQTHANSFPDGVFASRAMDLFQAGKETVVTSWIAETRATPLSTLMSTTPAASEAEARGIASQSAQEETRTRCNGYTIGGAYRVVTASHRATKFDCRQQANGFFCTASGEAECRLERKKEETIKTCGTP